MKLSRYQTIGLINILLGVPYALFSAVVSFFILPKLFPLLTQFSPSLFDRALLTALNFICLAIGLLNVMLGILGFTKTPQRHRYSKAGLLLAVITLLTGGLVIALLVIFAVGPVYNLTTSIEP